MLIVVAYALGHDFWNIRIGPIPITLDRLLLVGLLAMFAYQWRLGRITIRPFTAADWMLAAMLALFVASATFSGQPEITDGVTSKWGRLITGFLLPGVLYAIIRQLDITRRQWSRLLAALVVLGIYLAFTGAFEVTGNWSLVFPRYIANPNLGIHFGRARGPELNAVSLGLYLTACLLAAWTLFYLAGRRSHQLLLLVVMPLMAFGVLFTFTRSTWIGLAASAIVVAAHSIPRQWRVPAVVGAALVGLVVVTASWGQLIGLKREGTVEDSEHSVDQRESFTYVSWQMFCDHPILGVGFGRFYDQKLPYLSDRSQNFELESLRPLHHHNTLLSVLTETGLVGLAAFVGVFAFWIRCAWRLTVGAGSSNWVRAQGILMLALIANFMCSAVFHDLTLLASQELLLFTFAAITVNLHQRLPSRPSGPAALQPNRCSTMDQPDSPRLCRGLFRLRYPRQSVRYGTIPIHDGASRCHDPRLVPRTTKRHLPLCRHAEHRPRRALSAAGRPARRISGSIARASRWRAARVDRTPARPAAPRARSGQRLGAALVPSGPNSAPRFSAGRRARRRQVGRGPYRA